MEQSHPVVPPQLITTDLNRPPNASIPQMIADDHIDHFLYRAALRHMQRGEWEAGLIEMVWLAELYPLNQDLRSLIREMEIRSRIDVEEKEEKKQLRKQRARKILFGSIVLLAILAFLFIGSSVYSGWIREQAFRTQQSLEREVRLVQLGMKFRDAQSLLLAGDTAGARSLIEAIASIDPGYPGLASLLVEIDTRSEVDNLYLAALSEIAAGDNEKASDLLSEITENNPGYKDAEALLKNLEWTDTQERLIIKADEFAEKQDWISAIQYYEDSFNSEPAYRENYVEVQLFKSYINAAETAIAGGDDLIISQKASDEYFRKALSLRPQDPEVRIARERAHAYISGKEQFLAGHWADSISNLEFIIPDHMTYAGGTGLQMLIEAHLARGDKASQGGDSTNALVEYERAVELAALGGASDLRYFTALTRAGSSYISTGNYKPATQRFLTALEITPLKGILLTEFPEIAAGIENANAAIQGQKYEDGARLLQSLTSQLMMPLWFASYQVEADDNLLLISSRFGTTLEAIMASNDLTLDSPLTTDQVLAIPQLPG